MKQLITNSIFLAAFLLFLPATCYRLCATSADGPYQHSISFRLMLPMIRMR